MGINLSCLNCIQNSGRNSTQFQLSDGELTEFHSEDTRSQQILIERSYSLLKKSLKSTEASLIPPDQLEKKPPRRSRVRFHTMKCSDSRIYSSNLDLDCTNMIEKVKSKDPFSKTLSVQNSSFKNKAK